MSPWTARESPWARLNSSFGLRMSRTLTGWLVTLRGGSFGGAIASRRFSQNTRYQGLHSTSMRERLACFAEGGNGWKNSFRLPKKPSPYGSPMNAPPLGSRRTFTGRSARKSLRLEKKLAEIDRKSTRLNSSHLVISYAVFCLKKKNKSENSNLFLIEHPSFLLEKTKNG